MSAESQPIHGQWAVLPVPGKRPKMIGTTWLFAPRGDRRGGPDGAGALTQTNRSQLVINKRKTRAEGMGEVCLAPRPTPTPGLSANRKLRCLHFDSESWMRTLLCASWYAGSVRVQRRKGAIPGLRPISRPRSFSVCPSSVRNCCEARTCLDRGSFRGLGCEPAAVPATQLRWNE